MESVSGGFQTRFHNNVKLSAGGVFEDFMIADATAPVDAFGVAAE